jgi:ABC-2 type transport system permease protein
MGEPGVQPAANPGIDGRGTVSRFYGLGSVFGKTLRDSRWAVIGVAGLVGLTLIAGGASMSTAYGTPLARAEIAAYAQQIPAAMRGVYGLPINVGTLGGFVSWHYSGLFALTVGLWSILALSSTIAGELRRGSLEMVAASPVARRRIAVEKVAAHVTAMVVVMTLVALAAWLAGVLWARYPGDPVSPDAAAAFAIKLGLMGLVAGSVAFAFSSFMGGRASAGMGGAIMLGSYVINGWDSAIPAFGSVAGLTYFSWTESHLPLAGVFDWPSQLPMVAVVTVMLAIGIEGFVRRDMVAAGSLPLPGLPASTLGLGGPVRRSLGEQLPTALAWGIGLGAYGFAIAAASGAFAEGIRQVPELTTMVEALFPGIDFESPGGFLQLAFMEFGYVAIGLAAATFVAGWAADETSGRLEMTLTTPLPRARSAVAGGVAACGAIVVAIVLLAASIAVGATVASGDAVIPMSGTLVLALYGIGLTGVGIAVGGLFRPTLAAPAVALTTIAIFLVDFLAPTLDLPDWVHQLALSNHLGQPMIGTWDWAGMAACAALAVVGIAAGALGMRRRDVNA